MCGDEAVCAMEKREEERREGGVRWNGRYATPSASYGSGSVGEGEARDDADDGGLEGLKGEMAEEGEKEEEEGLTVFGAEGEGDGENE